MKEWLIALVRAQAPKLVPLLAALALLALSALGLVSSERAELARCVLVAAQPKNCVSQSSVSSLLGPLDLFRVARS